MSEKEKPRKYSFKNITKNMTVHVKELRKSLSPGKEVEWEGVLNPNTQRLVDGKFLEITDLGPSSGKGNKIKNARVKLEKDVKEIVAKQKRTKDESNASVSAVKHDEDLSLKSDEPKGKPEKDAQEDVKAGKRSKKASSRLQKLASKGSKDKE